MQRCSGRGVATGPLRAAFLPRHGKTPIQNTTMLADDATPRDDYDDELSTDASSTDGEPPQLSEAALCAELNIDAAELAGIRTCFGAFDVDGSQTIDRTELRALLSKMAATIGLHVLTWSIGM